MDKGCFQDIVRLWCQHVRRCCTCSWKRFQSISKQLLFMFSVPSV